jgi:hypothetical protein
METNGTLVAFQNDRIRVWMTEREGWFDVFDRYGTVFYGQVYATPCGGFASVRAGSSMDAMPPMYGTFFDAVEAL